MIRRFITILCAVFAVCCALAVANAQLTMTGVGGGFGVSGGAAPTYTATDNQTQNTSSTSVTFASVAIGAASSDRIVVVVVSTSSAIPSGMTIGGVTATLAANDVSCCSGLQIWYANVTTGTTASIVVTSGSAMSNESVNVGKLTGVTATPSSTNTAAGASTNPLTISVTVPSSGFGIVGMWGTSTTPTWTNATTDFNTLDSNSTLLASAHDSTAGTNTVSASNVSAQTAHMVSASWGP